MRFSELYVIIMSHTGFRMNLHSVVCWMSRNSLPPCSKQARYLKFNWQQQNSNLKPLCKRTLNHLTKLEKWLNGCVFVYELSGCSSLPVFENCVFCNFFYVLAVCISCQCIFLFYVEYRKMIRTCIYLKEDLWKYTGFSNFWSAKNWKGKGLMALVKMHWFL